MGTRVGHNLFEGMQGGYFIPVVLLLGLALPQFRKGRILRFVCGSLVLLFPLIVTACYLPSTVVYRY